MRQEIIKTQILRQSLSLADCFADVSICLSSRRALTLSYPRLFCLLGICLCVCIWITLGISLYVCVCVYAAIPQDRHFSGELSGAIGSETELLSLDLSTPLCDHTTYPQHCVCAWSGTFKNEPCHTCLRRNWNIMSAGHLFFHASCSTHMHSS